MFFVTAIRGRRVAYLAGPYEHHEDAVLMVSPARRIAEAIDPFCHFDLFGTTKADRSKPGVLNGKLHAFGAEDQA